MHDHDHFDFCIKTDGFLTLSQAAELVPPRANGKKATYSTLWKWAHQGRNGVRLKVWMTVSGHLRTTRSALQDFIDAQGPELFTKA